MTCSKEEYVRTGLEFVRCQDDTIKYYACLAIAVLVLLAVILSVLLLTCCCLPCLCCGTKEDGVDWSGKFAVGRFVMDVSFLRPYIYWILGREEELNETERISEVCYERNCYGPAATQRCTYYIV